MFPLSDSTPRTRFPFITLALMAANIAVFIHQILLNPYALEHFVYLNGMVPYRVSAFIAGRAPVDVALAPLFTSMFLHAGWMHLIGNMWFLWIFGDNIEDNFGHLNYLLFYVLCGLLASLTHWIAGPLSRIPSVGASGAIAGIMGAYMLLFPRARVLTLIPFFFIFTMELPAVVMLLYWFAIQFFSGVASVGQSQQAQGGVAFWAHIGGFAAGVALCFLFRDQRRLRGYYRMYD